MPRTHTIRRTPLSDLRAAVTAYRQSGGNMRAAARALGIADSTVAVRLAYAAVEGLIPKADLPQAAYAQAKHKIDLGSTHVKKLFEVEPLPSERAPVKDIIARRLKEYDRKQAAEEARRLIAVKIKMDGPIGIVHFGDPHVDDPGTDIGALERHLQTVKKTEGLFGANVGDMQNNWVGRLARLYGEQSTSAAEAWALTEWLVRSIDWLYMIGGNHDLWSGAGDPIQWIAAHQGTLYEPWGARLNLIFPNGKEIRVNARHDFAGHSMWNTAHGPAKAAQMGWRDHILTCGHKHTSGYQMLKDPASGLISHAIRVAGYKVHDRYGKELGLPNQNITPASVTIIDPQYADDDVRLITVIHDVEEAAQFLTWKRRRK